MQESSEQVARLGRLARAAGRVAAHVGAGLVDVLVALSLLLAYQTLRDGAAATLQHLRLLSAMGNWWLLGIFSLGLLLAWINALLFRLQLSQAEPDRPGKPPAAGERQAPVLD